MIRALRHSDLPKAKFKVWVPAMPHRFAEVDSEPGNDRQPHAVKAPNDLAAAQYYPAIYWYA